MVIADLFYHQVVTQGGVRDVVWSSGVVRGSSAVLRQFVRIKNSESRVRAGPDLEISGHGCGEREGERARPATEQRTLSAPDSRRIANSRRRSGLHTSHSTRATRRVQHTHQHFFFFFISLSLSSPTNPTDRLKERRRRRTDTPTTDTDTDTDGGPRSTDSNRLSAPSTKWIDAEDEDEDDG